MIHNGRVGEFLPCPSDVSLKTLRGESQIKNVPKSGKSPKGGGGVSEKNQKVQNLKFGLFDKRGGESKFSIFSQM